MRLAPVALYRWKDLESAADEAVLQSRTTHAAPEVLDAVRLMAHLLCRLVQSGRWTDVLAEPRPAFVAARVQALSELAWRGRDRSASSSPRRSGVSQRLPVRSPSSAWTASRTALARPTAVRASSVVSSGRSLG